jgi:hypothetical protein
VGRILVRAWQVVSLLSYPDEVETPELGIQERTDLFLDGTLKVGVGAIQHNNG